MPLFLFVFVPNAVDRCPDEVDCTPIAIDPAPPDSVFTYVVVPIKSTPVKFLKTTPAILFAWFKSSPPIAIEEDPLAIVSPPILIDWSPVACAPPAFWIFPPIATAWPPEALEL